MTTPSSDEPVGATTPAEPVVPGDATTPGAAATPPPPVQLPPPPPVYGPPVFAPVPRPPRTPWINPARRTQVAGAAIIAALVLIGGGFGIGYAAAPSGHGHDAPYRMFRGGYGPMMGGPIDGRFDGPGMRGRPGRPFPTPSVPASPASPAPTS